MQLQIDKTLELYLQNIINLHKSIYKLIKR